MEASKHFLRRAACVVAMVVLLVSFAAADVFNLGGTRNPDGTWTGLASLETVPVGNPGNAGELSGWRVGGQGPYAVVGGVDYEFNIGKYAVTAAQYTVFLNAVAATDPYGLYNTEMWTKAAGCKIQRHGTSGSYTYSVAADWANRPVHYVSWGDAARFANWLHNGQPTGAQGPGTTETGAYTLNGAMTREELMGISRNADWQWAIPSEDEWYKAAYHKNDGVTGNYWHFPTSSDSVPSNQLIDPDPGNNATFWDDGYTIGSPYWRTEVGEHENSASPYGTFDQGGNVHEWNEAIIGGDRRGYRGGAGYAWSFVNDLQASYRLSYSPAYECFLIGFRVSEFVCPSADLTGDCFVDIEDFAVLVSQWLTGRR